MTRSKAQLIVALDVEPLAAARELVARLRHQVSLFKVGMQLLTAEGPNAVKFLRDAGFGVFYDGKFHDIPRTVAASVAAACRLGATLVNVHAAGGFEMMAAAAQAAQDAATPGQLRTQVLAVTVLTSLNQKILAEEVGVQRTLEEQVVALARLAQSAGLDGVVASPQEIQAIRRACGPEFIILTPGIRPAGSDAKDQKRVLTPTAAVAAGADYLVVGRPVTEAADPAAVVKQILAEMEEAGN